MTGCEHICYVNCGLSGDDCHCYRVSMSPPGSLLPSIPSDAIAARETRDAQMRAEGRVAGLREAAEIAGLNAWKHAGEDDYSRGMDAGAAHQVKACCDAIRALADKIDGDTVKTGGHYRECGE